MLTFAPFALRCFYTVKRMSVFTRYLNPITGESNWEEKHPDYDFYQEIARTAFADMLHDRERNEKYYTALKAAIRKKHESGEEAHVLDIGTGTGLLAMMAAKCGADTVTACEAFRPMANCASKIIERNGFGEQIKLIRKRSTKMTVGFGKDMARRANILVTEVFDTELIGEGALLTFRHAHEELLEEGSIVVPNNGTLWAQVVESPSIRSWNRINSIGVMDSTIVPPPVMETCPGSSAVHDVQLTQIPYDSFTPLLPPQTIFKFDWSSKTSLELKEMIALHVKPIATGMAHAILVWWDLEMDTEGQILLSCAPVWARPEAKIKRLEGASLSKLAEEIPWRDHWLQAIYYPPVEVPISIDKEVTLVGSHDDYSLWFHIENEEKVQSVIRQGPVCDCYLHIAYSRSRIGQLNDQERNEKFLKVLQKHIKPNYTCLCLTDGCLLALAVAKLGAKVILLEDNNLSRRTMESFVDTNGLTDKVQIVQSIQDCAEKVDLIFGEPYFVLSILPWDNLRFWYFMRNYPPEIPRIPAGMTIWGIAVEFKDLQKIRAPLGTCEGFDVALFDELVQKSSDISDAPVEAQPLWEYPGRALSLPFKLWEVDFYDSVDEYRYIELQNTSPVPILTTGKYNGIALWVDWQLDNNTMVSTGPTKDIVPGTPISWYPFVRQGVHLCRNIIDVTSQHSIAWKLFFDPSEGNIKFSFNSVLDSEKK
ncbi:protein arginine N-methyltransferase 7 [Orussus abietinus]|uniref:protein arginine N-methyltransferase 7 n=1 Tax=Orussus abietinus TaxID=222816 RepID=UPI0006261715|nr:protein arginine N-methyltransferase 7 [Orussus abietinus]